MQALKGVWASKYNDRAYYSLRKVDLNFDDVRMAVLVQVGAVGRFGCGVYPIRFFLCTQLSKQDCLRKISLLLFLSVSFPLIAGSSYLSLPFYLPHDL